MAGSIVNAVLVSPAAADDDLVGGEVGVLDAEPAPLEHAEAGAVEQAGHEARYAVELLEHGADLVAAEDDGQPLGALGTHDAVEPGKVDLQHVAVQEQEGAQGLVLGRGRDVAAHGQRGEEAGDLWGAHLGRVALAVEEDVALDPRDVGVFGPAAIGAGAQGGALGRGAAAWAQPPDRPHAP